MTSEVDLTAFRFRSSAKVRFCETDANGHMSHVTTVIFMEQARTEYSSGLGLFGRERSADDGKTFVLAAQSVNYRSQAYFADEIDIFVRVSRIGTSSLDMEYVLINRDSGAVVSTGSSTMVYFDSTLQKSTPLPADLSERIERFEASFGS
ncbi:acyl-CoA thioesterase [Paenibacillus chartarius]|uniref:Acyl-CoA thioesterase n=1 Tax=Paenibacillus chartarius TaxID=747481 RepID=A0ABV6DVH6_9BACL